MLKGGLVLIWELHMNHVLILLFILSFYLLGLKVQLRYSVWLFGRPNYASPE